jgi:hypothetical protein
MNLETDKRVIASGLSLMLSLQLLVVANPLAALADEPSAITPAADAEVISQAPSWTETSRSAQESRTAEATRKAGEDQSAYESRIAEESRNAEMRRSKQESKEAERTKNSSDKQSRRESREAERTKHAADVQSAVESDRAEATKNESDAQSVEESLRAEETRKAGETKSRRESQNAEDTKYLDNKAPGEREKSESIEKTVAPVVTEAVDNKNSDANPEVTKTVEAAETQTDGSGNGPFTHTNMGLEAGSILSPDGRSIAAIGEASQDKTPQVGENGTMSTADNLSNEMLIQLGATMVQDGDQVKEAQSTADGIIVVDSDEADEVEQRVQYEDLPTDEGKTRVRTGAKFPVVVISQISSKTAKQGDPLEARLKYDLKIGDRLIAKKGSVVNGHINYCLKARSVMHSLVSHERWYRNSGCLGFQFDEILNDKGEHIPLVAMPAQMSRIVKNKAEGRELGVNHAGQITGPWGQQLRYKALRIGLNAALAPAGVFSFGAMPVALGVIGAANPSFAFMKPVGTNVRHRRIKGFAWGFLSGIPGSWIIEDTVTKGQEAIIKPGDEFLAEFKEEFTGEAASEAQLMPNAQTKVKGDVREGKDSKKKKDK